jgi:hypothetical protein
LNQLCEEVDADVNNEEDQKTNQESVRAVTDDDTEVDSTEVDSDVGTNNGDNVPSTSSSKASGLQVAVDAQNIRKS